MIGRVVSVKMDKTAVVSVERRYPHTLYHKIVRSTKRYKAHDPNNAAVLGDVVRIVETRPISKQKRWRIMETLVRGNVAEIAPREIGASEQAEYEGQRSVADVADETPMTTDSEVLEAASDDMDARDYNAPASEPVAVDNASAAEAENVTPDVTVPERTAPARTPDEASADETPMSLDSDILEAAADDMDPKDYEAEEKQ
jgi:small subunit ribosomal protein S17